MPRRKPIFAQVDEIRGADMRPGARKWHVADMSRRAILTSRRMTLEGAKSRALEYYADGRHSLAVVYVESNERARGSIGGGNAGPTRAARNARKARAFLELLD